jgi:hypothetical protein
MEPTNLCKGVLAIFSNTECMMINRHYNKAQLWGLRGVDRGIARLFALLSDPPPSNLVDYCGFCFTLSRTVFWSIPRLNFGPCG